MFSLEAETRMHLKRIVVIGTTGTGKTTFAGALARILSLPHIELDALHWNPNWRETPKELFIEKVDAATKAPAWIVDGNYTTKVSPIIWQRADTIVWLDYPFRLIFYRLLTRTLRRALLGEECCNGNRESWRQALSKDSIILWAFHSHWRHQREYDVKLRDPVHGHLWQVRLRSPKETVRWIAQIKQTIAND